MKKSKKFITLLTALLLTSCNSVNDDSTLTIYCWSISSINTAKKTNSPIYQKIKENTNADIIAKTINSSAFSSMGALTTVNLNEGLLVMESNSFTIL